ncbi:hypothetical protein SpyM6JRS4_06055 [Streptococcus pyogenes JRS4]|nr:hypothetical phage protein [Streptococcus pyogenes MGAS8232]AAT87476.1 unknown phage protein [Streptococcus pyogenes MGAS10394]AKI76504.1 hypothetical protein SpyM6JRS4_06055 [Streptococcus pyogenes JRS4]AKI78175.1 hypothetical protein SpyM6D471_06055 [Streptococcus pyogenes]HER4585193.1 hypothetical protein [Streptococcus pyogenes NGAS618]HER4598736.1 hypothetical protein [Streptococcus pyogenes NGAS606]HER4613417.1 hypothetical protein [Streptococcus pyogenes NGAS603]HER4635802.1 hypoth
MLLLKYIIREVVSMATKTFTRDFSFTAESADSLIRALNRNVTPKTVDVSHIKELTAEAEIKAFFGKK